MTEDKYTILAVDDDLGSLSLIRHLIKRAGHEALTAGSGEEGLMKLEETGGEVDLVLLDINLPGIDGLETCRRMKSHPVFSACPVIMMTAMAEMELLTKGFKAGAVDYIQKPLKVEEFLARLNSALRLRETQKKLIEAEKRATFGATVVTANHEINQPLHVIMGNFDLMLEELKRPSLDRERLAECCRNGAESVERIASILHKMAAMETPQFKEYARGVTMVDIDGPTKKQHS